jgi:hypothetical protein
MNQEYKYPPDTSWFPVRGAARGWQWGVGSIAISLAPFAWWAIVGLNDDFRLELLCWFIGTTVGLTGLRHRSTTRTLAWIGVLMNVSIPLIGWMLAPLLAGLMMSRGMR